MQGALIHGISEQFLWRPIQVEVAYYSSLNRFFPRLDALILSGFALLLMWITVLGILGVIIGLLVGFIPVAGATIGTIITAPFLIIAHTILYFDLRTQKDEAFNLEVLASDLRIEVEESPGS